MKLPVTILTLSILFLASCAEQNSNEESDAGLAAMNPDSLAASISILASDSFQGRKPFSAGEQMTIAYLEEKFRAIGLEPGNGDSYFQEVPMVKISTTASPVMSIKSSNSSFELKGLEDYVIWTDKTDPQITLRDAEIVFAGYGVVAPEYNWNDYKDLDVKGKVVLIMVNDPGFHTGQRNLFKGDTMTYYGRWTYKFEEAARQGAIGCLIIHNTKAASYPFTVVQNNWNGSRLRLDPKGKQETLCNMIGWVSETAARKLLAAAGQDSSLLTKADSPGFRGVALGINLSAEIAVKTEFNKSNNVIGIIKGETVPEETIIYTAHWDHLGIGKPDATGDSIYNGALDNASATAGLLELARAFKSLPTKPARTIVFLAVTAEEQGLWGSAYYAENPIFPIESTVANINMDGLNWYGTTRDIVVVGKGQNELEDYLTEAATSQNREITFENHPEAGSYYRSDHFNFARKGVPALYTSSGVEVKGEPGLGLKVRDDYTASHYHRPSDEFDPKTWKLDGAIADLQLMFLVARRLAYGKEWPVWKDGSEFKKIRDARKNQ